MKALFLSGVVISFGPVYESMDASNNVYNVPDDYDFGKYTYTAFPDLSYNPNGFALTQIPASVDFELRQSNVNEMSQYMASLVPASLSQANFDLFLSDTSAFVPQYLGGGSRLITWIETVNRNGYNATSVGFKTNAGYRGTLLSGTAGAGGQYQRATDILAILNNL